MIYAYGITEQGTYHIKNNNIPCQDYHHIVKCGDNLAIASVADGLGSEEHSDIASRIAATVSVKYCAEKIVQAINTADILYTIKQSFVLAQNSIEKKAKDNGHSIDQYDTTLILAVMRGDTLYYGHSGDSGIIALTVEGLYEQVTEQQRDEDDYVFPLYRKEKWVFEKHDKKVCSILLATDGIFETFFPVYIKNEPVNIHVALARFFMDNSVLRIDESGEDAVKARIGEFIHNIPDEQVNDDKTLVVLVNPSIESKEQPDDYYKEPDWAELKRKHDEEWKRKAYPHLFKDQDKEVVVESSSANDGQKSNKAEKAPHENVLTEATKKLAENKKTPAEKPRKGFFSWLLGPAPPKK